MKKIIYNIWEKGYVLLFLLTSFYITFYSSAGTPIRADYHQDSTFFMLMGQMLLEGKVPYVDFFDHKGPSLILIEAIGQFLASGRMGIYLIEIASLFISLVLIFKTAKLVLKNTEAYAICLLFLIYIKYNFVGGNTTEELSFVPNFICLYYFVRVFFKKEILSAKQALIIGVCFSFLFWLKATHGLVIASLCAAMGIFFIIEKDFQSLKRLVVYFLLGLLPFTLLYIVFFAWHGALYELFYGTFLHNILYVKNTTGFNIPLNTFNVFLIILLSIGSIYYYIKWRDFKILIVSSLLLISSLVAGNIGNKFGHYLLTMAPSIVFGAIIVFKSLKFKWSSVILCSMIFLFALRLFYYQVDSMLYMKEHVEKRIEDRRVQFQSIMNELDREEIRNVFYYDVFIDVYPLMNITPNYKYFALQEWMGHNSDVVFDEINDMMEHKSPEWVMIQIYWHTEDGEKDFSKYENQKIVEVLKNKYKIRKEVGPYLLFELK